MCESKELIVGYVYDELSNDERATVDRHLVGCVECRIEIEELRSTRTHLTLWAPPEPVGSDVGPRRIQARDRPTLQADASGHAELVALRVSHGHPGVRPL